MRTPRRPSRLATLRLLAAIAIGGGAYSVYLMACQLATGVGDKFAITSVPPAQLNGTYNIPYSVQFTTVHGTSPYTWKVVPNQGSSTVSPMPPGLTLDPNGATAGLLHGVPGAGSVGMYDFTIQATDNNNTVAMYAVCLTIYFQITPNPLTPATALSPYSVQLSGQGGTGPYGSWSTVASSPPPSWLSVSATGQLSGTPPAMGTATFSLQGKDANGNPGLQAETLTIGPALMITTASLPNGTVGAAYANGTGVTLAATGGVPPYTWSYTGSLPSNLSLNPNTGLLSGTPNTSGPVSITVIVTDHAMNTASQPFNFNIAAAGSALAIATNSPLPGGTVGTVYNTTGLQFAATGGTTPYTWAITSVPTTIAGGLTLSSTGLLSGTPTTAGTFTFTVQATDATMPTAQMASQTFKVTIALAPLAITTSSPLPGGTVGTVYNTSGLQFAAMGGTTPYTWAITSSPTTIAGGLTLSSTGLLSGTPTTAGTFTFTVQATDATMPTAQMTSQTFKVTIAPAPLVITTTSPLTAGTVGTVYNTTGVQFAAMGGTMPYSWAITSVPTTIAGGLTLSSTGLLSGTPTTAGTFTFTVQAADATMPTAQMTSQMFKVTIAPAPLVITTASPLPSGMVGQSYTTPLVATGGTGTYTWTASAGVPTGLTLNSDGTWSGMPTVANTFSFTATVTSGAAMVSKNFMVTINPASTSLEIITGMTLPSAADTSYYGMTFTAFNGASPYTWKFGSAITPPGLTLSASGFLSGIPTSIGTTTFPVTVTDNNGAMVTGSFTLTVGPASSSCVMVPVTLPDVVYASTALYKVTLRVSDACIANQPGYNAWEVDPTTSLPIGFNFNGSSTADTASVTALGVSVPPGTYNFSIIFHGQDTTPPLTGGNVTQAFTLKVH